MNSAKKTPILDDMKINVKIKLSALWAAVMFLYAYADIKAFFRPGIIEGLIAGKAGDIQITQGFLLGSAVIMAAPSVMIFLSLALKAPVNRWVNIILGITYSGIIIGTLLMGGAWAYYIFYAAIEIILTGLIVWYAVKWPKQEAGKHATSLKQAPAARLP
ncbi:MAG: DUF6326 family protein [Anaerolineales bacterium]|jgi:hypothetical protein